MISIARPKACGSAAVEDEQLVAGGNRRGPMGHDDDGAAHRLHRFDRGIQGLRTVRVEGGVRFIEDQDDGIIVERAGEAKALLLPAGQGDRRPRDRVSYPSGSDRMMSWARADFAAATTCASSGVRPSARCSRRRCRRRTAPPAAGSRGGDPAFRPVLVQVAPASRTSPAEGAVSPIRMRASVVLPAPLRPMMPSASPGLRWNDTWLSTGLSPRRRTSETDFTSRCAAGRAGPSSGSRCGGLVKEVAQRPSTQRARAAPPHWDTPRRSGPARDPEDAGGDHRARRHLVLRTNHAPRARMADCRNRRKARMKDENDPVQSLARIDCRGRHLQTDPAVAQGAFHALRDDEIACGLRLSRKPTGRAAPARRARRVPCGSGPG
jgi:hypothetical protein